MSFPRYLLIALVLVLHGCDDLYPSAEDKRQPVDENTIGYNVGQIAPNFSLLDTEYNMVDMQTELASTDGIVLYFTMWCPVCSSHMDDLRTRVIPNFPNVKFYIIDFVSGTVEYSRAEQRDNGYLDLTVLVDSTQEVLNLYNANMGITVVIENAITHGIVRMNEEYKSTKLIDVLTALP